MTCSPSSTPIHESLATWGREAIEILRFTVPAIHIEKYGSANRGWDALVGQTVQDAFTKCPVAQSEPFKWYAVHLKWFVMPMYYPQDLDNLRLKPVLDALTSAGLWPDDHIEHVRAIYSEAYPVKMGEQQRLEAIIYGIP